MEDRGRTRGNDAVLGMVVHKLLKFQVPIPGVLDLVQEQSGGLAGRVHFRLSRRSVVSSKAHFFSIIDNGLPKMQTTVETHGTIEIATGFD